MSVPYQYKNHLSFCPECGTKLAETDYDCPGCGVNLVGYNEKHNRARNLQQSAQEMESLARKNDELNRKIDEENRKNATKDKRSKEQKKNLKRAVCIFGICVILLFVVFGIIINIQESIRKSKFDSMTYEEVVDYLDTDDWNHLHIDEVSDWEVVATDTKTSNYGIVTVNKGYDSKEDATFIESVFEPIGSDKKYSITHQYDADILYGVETSIYTMDVEYYNRYFYSEEIDTFDGSEDEYFLYEHVFEDYPNYVEKLGICEIGDYTMHVYAMDNMDINDNDYLICLIKVDDNFIYEFDMHTSSQDYFDELMENYTEYIRMSVEVKNVE